MGTWWLVGGGLGGVAVLLFLPIIFEREVRYSQFLSATFRLKYLQHLFPDDGKRIGAAFATWLPYKDRWRKLTPSLIGKKVRTIRELTGAEVSNQVDAVALAGALVRDIASSNWVEPTGEAADKVMSAGEILAFIADTIDESFEVSAEEWEQPELQGKVREWLRQTNVDLEQVVELVLAAVEVLQARAQLRLD